MCHVYMYDDDTLHCNGYIHVSYMYTCTCTCMCVCCAQLKCTGGVPTCTHAVHVHVLTPYMCVLMPYMCMYLSPGTLVQQSKHTYMYMYFTCMNIDTHVCQYSIQQCSWCCVCVDARRQNVGRFLLR